MVDVQTVSIVIASASIVAGILYYLLDIRNQSKIRQTSMVMIIFSKFGSKGFQAAWQEVMNRDFKNYDDYVKEHGLAEVWEVAMLFEGLGTLVHRRLVNIDVVDDLQSGPIKSTWEKMKPIIEGYREHSHEPQFCEWFEYLHDELEKKGQRIKYGRRTKT
jgi:hypothetical protein